MLQRPKAESQASSPAPEAEQSDPLSFAELKLACMLRQREWDASGILSLEYRALEMFGEAGEACNVVKKLIRERLGLPGSRSSVAALAEELADVVICADLVATHEGIDLGAAVREKFNKTSEELISSRPRERSRLPCRVRPTFGVLTDSAAVLDRQAGRLRRR
jgi:NTP pyrophosphatase (non-canonical NTP hydrolase)